MAKTWETAQRWEVRRVWQWAPGEVKGHEDEPPDLLDARGVLIEPLGWWPEVGAFGIGVADRETAVAAANSQWNDEGRPITLDARINKARFEELQNRERPGYEGTALRSIVASWLVRDVTHVSEVWYHFDFDP